MTSSLFFSLVAASALLGCGVSPSFEDPETTPARERGDVERMMPFHVGESWRGAINCECDRDSGALAVSVDQIDEDDVAATALVTTSAGTRKVSLSGTYDYEKHGISLASESGDVALHGYVSAGHYWGFSHGVLCRDFDVSALALSKSE